MPDRDYEQLNGNIDNSCVVINKDYRVERHQVNYEKVKYKYWHEFLHMPFIESLQKWEIIQS